MEGSRKVLIIKTGYSEILDILYKYKQWNKFTLQWFGSNKTVSIYGAKYTDIVPYTDYNQSVNYGISRIIVPELSNLYTSYYKNNNGIMLSYEKLYTTKDGNKKILR